MVSHEQLALAERAERGISGSAFQKIRRSSPFDDKDWALLLGLSPHALKRFQEKGTRFDVVHSDKILLLDQLNRRGIEVFGAKGPFYDWLQYPNRALDGRRPRNLAVSAFGISLILEELGRIEHGIFA